ncbi:MAG: LacI family DNA-binding transcriptional regulator [Acidimicrobiales bacterium]|jgi:LacI family transcriptional regulator
MTTISDVARAAGVSTATVSRVLNDSSSVRPHLVVKVRRAIDALDYQPSRVARSLRTHRAQVWALIVDDIRNPFFTDMVRGVEDIAYTEGYSLFLCNAEQDALKEASYLNLALAERVAGVIVTPTKDTLDVSALLDRGVAVVTADRKLRNHDVDSVVVDNVLGAKQAVRHLLAGGYTRIGCITGPLDVTTGAERFAGYRLALQEAGIQFVDSLVRTGDFREAGGHQAMQELLHLRRRPDAVFVGNNLMTMGALYALAEAGLLVPDDVAIVSFDDMAWASLLKPSLTSVAQPIYDLGVETARLLLSRISGYSGAARMVVLSPSLKIRQSSAPKMPPRQS